MTAVAQNGVYPWDDMANPSGMKVLAVDRHGLCWRFRVFSYFVWCAIVEDDFQSCVRVWSATGAGKGRDPAFLVYAGLSWVLKLDKNALVTLVPMPKRRGLAGAAAEMCVEDGVRDSLWYGCEPKSVSAAQILSPRALRSSRARQIASSIVWGSEVDMATGTSPWHSAATGKSFILL